MSWSPLDREEPFEYIKEAIRLFDERNGEVIVEIGTIRQRYSHPLDTEPEDCPSRLDGHALAHYNATGKTFFTCDISPKAIALAREYTAENPKAVVVQEDGIKFLRNFQKKVDLLSLDAWDVDLPNCAEKHLEAYKAIKRRLHDKTVVIIDDTDVVFADGKLQPVTEGWGGKGRLLVPAMLKNGWKTWRTGRCTILLKDI